MTSWWPATWPKRLAETPTRRSNLRRRPGVDAPKDPLAWWGTEPAAFPGVLNDELQEVTGANRARTGQ
jgi:hypothetical protein